MTLKAGHVQPVWAGHPWVFAQAVAAVDKAAAGGDEVLVIDPVGKVIGRGLYSPSSAIAVRLFSTDASVGVDDELLRAKIQRAVLLRRAAGLPDDTPDRSTNGYRLVHGEGDCLPGLIVDVYDDVLAVQFGSIGLKRREAGVLDALESMLEPRAIIDRTPGQVARAEGFGIDTVDAARGPVVRGDTSVDRLRFVERGLTFELPLELSQKTGYYFDQRLLRARVEDLVGGSEVIDACCFVGSFALTAARAGAKRVVAVDKSAPALEVARHCAELNGLADRIEFVEDDAGNALRKAAKQGGADVVLCDPPKLSVGSSGVGSRKAQQRALKAYRRLATDACAALRSGGLLSFSSCSASVGLDSLQRVLALGAKQIDRRMVVLERLFQGPDHPVPAAFPEGLYLTTLVGRVEEL
ncbi:MAG: class I SAM-dependent rRNA methyltransferase [Deltaproteobacteria bacterium]|nr:class I SAM-dependent rRNA methyltransferase [Deltaproteobacteria bacterium]MBW2535376.1 class I SAM-dependent rRNA methyltransferase [Deltaproteobacteria bacterium]